MDSSIQPLDQVKASALDMAVRFGPKLVVAVIILFVGYMVGRWAGRALENLLVRLNLDAPVDLPGDWRKACLLLWGTGT